MTKKESRDMRRTNCASESQDRRTVQRPDVCFFFNGHDEDTLDVVQALTQCVSRVALGRSMVMRTDGHFIADITMTRTKGEH